MNLTVVLYSYLHIYFIGNDAIHEITSRGDYKLKIRLTGWSNTTKFAYYHTFVVANESDGYRLTISGYSGEAGKYYKHQENMSV